MSDKDFLKGIENVLSSEQSLQFAQEMIVSFNRLMSYYKCAMMEIETKFRVLKEEYSLRHDRNPINTIESRLKRMQSIKEKLERRGVPVSIRAIEEELNDVAGIRVICSFAEDVYTIAETFLKQDDITLIEKKDYIKNPKENGYRSLHLIVAVPIFLENEKRIMMVEVQLRTIAMVCWANLEHQLNYKKEHGFTEKMKKELADCAMLSAQLDEKMDELRRKVSI